MDIPSWCRVGQKVVCIDGDWVQKVPLPNPPRERETYVISDVEHDFEGIWLRFIGLHNPTPGGGVNAAFNHLCFRPLVSQQDDIETHFAHFLTSGKDARISEGV